MNLFFSTQRDWSFQVTRPRVTQKEPPLAACPERTRGMCSTTASRLCRLWQPFKNLHTFLFFLLSAHSKQGCFLDCEGERRRRGRGRRGGQGFEESESWSRKMTRPREAVTHGFLKVVLGWGRMLGRASQRGGRRSEGAVNRGFLGERGPACLGKDTQQLCRDRAQWAERLEHNFKALSYQ